MDAKKPLVVCYSLTGRTRRICGCVAKALGADYAEMKEPVRRSKLSAYTLGMLGALRRKNGSLRPVAADISTYDCLVVACPVWAGNLPPVVNVFLREYQLAGKTVYGLVTFGGNAGKAADCLREDLSAAGAWCPNVLGVLSSREMIHDLKAGRKAFALDEEKKLILEDRKPG